MKKLLVLFLSLGFVFSLAACDDDTDPVVVDDDPIVDDEPVDTTGIPTAVQGDLKMVLIKQWGTGTHMVTHINGVLAEAELYGIDMSVVDADNSLTAMSDAIFTAVTNEVDAILLSHGTTDSLQSAVDAALAAGIPVIAFDVDFAVDEATADAALVSLDQNDLMMGLMSQSFLVEELDGAGDVIYNRLAGITPTDKRHYIWEGAILPTFPGINVVATIDEGTDGAMAKAQTAMEAALIANSGADAVFAVWDEYAKGFYNAIVDADVDLPMYSIDISDQDLAMMQARPDIWRASAAVDPTVVGQVQVRLALKTIAGEDIPRYYSLTPVLIKVDDLPSDVQVTMVGLADYYDGWGSTTEFLTDWMASLEALNE